MSLYTWAATDNLVGGDMWFKKRKSRKQLLQEKIDKLYEELDAWKNMYYAKDLAFEHISKNIQTINASCITHGDDPGIAKESLCNLLAKAMSPYITIESYQMVGEPWYGEWKHCATIQILTKE